MTTLLVNHNCKSQPAQIVNVFAEYVKVLFADGSKAYLARTPDGRGTSAPHAYKTATRAREIHSELCETDAANKLEAEALASVTMAAMLNA